MIEFKMTSNQNSDTNVTPCGQRFLINYKPSDPIKSRYNWMVFLLIISVTIAMVSILWVTYLWIKSNEIKSQLKPNQLFDTGRQIINELTAKTHVQNENRSEETKFDLKSLFNIAKDAVRKFNETIHSDAGH